jgi:hypothetical protein
MNIFKKIFQFSFLATLSFVVVACTSDDTETSTVNSSDIESTQISTRGITTKVKSKAFYFKSLASFEDGASKMNIDDLAALEGKEINFVVLYDASAPWAEVFSTGKYTTTGNDILNGLMESYELEIVDQFDIDEENEGFVLEPLNKLDDPLKTARELSLVDNVFMVQLKEVPPVEEVLETADNN